MITVNSISDIAGGYKCERKGCKQKASKRAKLTTCTGSGDYLFCEDCIEDLLNSKNTKYEGK